MWCPVQRSFRTCRTVRRRTSGLSAVYSIKCLHSIHRSTAATCSPSPPRSTLLPSVRLPLAMSVSVCLSVGIITSYTWVKTVKYASSADFSQMWHKFTRFRACLTPPPPIETSYFVPILPVRRMFDVQCDFLSSNALPGRTVPTLLALLLGVVMGQFL